MYSRAEDTAAGPRGSELRNSTKPGMVPLRLAAQTGTACCVPHSGVKNGASALHVGAEP